MSVTLWNDYICPWAYAARPHTEWLRSQGVDVRVRSYELHPNLPSEGKAVRPGGRLDQVFDVIALECRTAELGFNKPQRSPNSHRVLGVVELVSAHWPQAFERVDAALAELHWVAGGALDDAATIDLILEASGVDVAALRDREADGEGERLLASSMADAREVEVTGTPAWRIGAMTITGLHPREQFERWASRLLERSEASD